MQPSQREPPRPQDGERDVWETDSALGGAQSYAYASSTPIAIIETKEHLADPLPNRSSLMSLSPSVYAHVEEHGRTYHAYKSGSESRIDFKGDMSRLDVSQNICYQMMR